MSTSRLDEALATLQATQFALSCAMARVESLEYAHMNSTLDVDIHMARVNAALYDHEVKIQALRLPMLDPPGQRAMRVNGLIEAILITAACDLVLHSSEATALRWLLRTQSTCKQMNAVIDTSPTLQQMLFFTPDPLCGKVRVNPLLNQSSINRVLNLGVSTNTHFTLLPNQPIGGRCFEAMHLDLVEQTFSGASHRLTFAATDICAGRKISRYSSRCRNCKGKDAGEGSWRNMYMSQPPFRVYFEMKGKTWDEERLWKGVRGDCVFGEIVQRLDGEAADGGHGHS